MLTLVKIGGRTHGAQMARDSARDA